MEVYVDDETKLTLHGLQQHYVKLMESEKNRKLFDLLDLLEFNQVSDDLLYVCYCVCVGCDLCQDRCSLHCSQPAIARTSISIYLYS